MDVIELPGSVAIGVSGRNDQMFKILREYSLSGKEEKKKGERVALNKEEIERKNKITSGGDWQQDINNAVVGWPRWDSESTEVGHQYCSAGTRETNGTAKCKNQRKL